MTQDTHKHCLDISSVFHFGKPSSFPVSAFQNIGAMEIEYREIFQPHAVQDSFISVQDNHSHKSYFSCISIIVSFNDVRSLRVAKQSQIRLIFQLLSVKNFQSLQSFISF